MKDFELLGTLIASPSAAFLELRERPRFWLPLTLILLATMALYIGYFSIVDVPWFADMQLSMNPRTANLSPEARERIIASMTRTTVLVSSVVFASLITLCILLIQALYYWVAGKVVGITQSFKHWFTMICWAGLPVLISVVAALLGLYTETAPLQMRIEQIQVLSLNELFFHVPPGEKGMTFLSSMLITTPLNWALTIVCVRAWSGRSWASSATFALLPSVLAYSVFAYFSFR